MVVLIEFFYILDIPIVSIYLAKFCKFDLTKNYGQYVFGGNEQ
jgi:hypothetical protein